MNLRHAAALAFVGWYLIAPPIVQDPGYFHPNLKAPLSEWDVNNRFDSKVECEKRLAKEKGMAENPESLAIGVKQLNGIHGGIIWRSDDLRSEVINEQCIASHDPRFKEK